jgi:hypothetical protein
MRETRDWRNRCVSAINVEAIRAFKESRLC